MSRQTAHPQCTLQTGERGRVSTQNSFSNSSRPVELDDVVPFNPAFARDPMNRPTSMAVDECRGIFLG
jgi:hypothetical protein